MYSCSKAFAKINLTCGFINANNCKGREGDRRGKVEREKGRWEGGEKGEGERILLTASIHACF
jgi:hypothetical protein